MYIIIYSLILFCFLDDHVDSHYLVSWYFYTQVDVTNYGAIHFSNTTTTFVDHLSTGTIANNVPVVLLTCHRIKNLQVQSSSTSIISQPFFCARIWSFSLRRTSKRITWLFQSCWRKIVDAHLVSTTTTSFSRSSFHIQIRYHHRRAPGIKKYLGRMNLLSVLHSWLVKYVKCEPTLWFPEVIHLFNKKSFHEEPRINDSISPVSFVRRRRVTRHDPHFT